jgi:hypothetical protein
VKPGLESQPVYDADFYLTETLVARDSAEATLPLVFDMIPVHTVIDVGCGTGAWAYTAQKMGRPSLGVDTHVPRDMLLVDTYIDCDLSQGYPCGGFDLAICLEVAEHLPDTSAFPLVAGLSRARAVLFSAATPGQPGVGHINCQPHEYWHGLFLSYGLAPEHLGPRVPEVVADFYRRNMFLYTRSQ